MGVIVADTPKTVVGGYRPANWNRDRAAIIKLEAISFPPEMRSSEDYLRKIIEHPYSLSRICEVGGQAIAYLAAAPLAFFSDHAGCKDDPDLNAPVIYWASFGTREDFRKHLFGLVHLAYQNARNCRYIKIKFHAREKTGLVKLLENLPELTNRPLHSRARAIQTFKKGELFYPGHYFQEDFAYMEMPIDSEWATRYLLLKNNLFWEIFDLIGNKIKKLSGKN